MESSPTPDVSSSVGTKLPNIPDLPNQGVFSRGTFAPTSTPPASVLSSDESAPEFDSDSESESEQGSDTREPRSTIVKQFVEFGTFTIEEIFEDGIGYDDLQVIHPYHIEEPSGNTRPKLMERNLIDAFEELWIPEVSRTFESTPRDVYPKQRQRWSSGGYKKRSHAQSIGGEVSEVSDVVPLHDTTTPEKSARRLRRRVQGPQDRKRSAATLFADVKPKELGEISVEDGPPPPTPDSDSDVWSGDNSSNGGGAEDIELILPSWLVDVEYNQSEPSPVQPITSENNADNTGADNSGSEEFAHRVSETADNSVDVTENDKPIDSLSRSTTLGTFGPGSDTFSFEQATNQRRTAQDSPESDTESEMAYSLPSIDSIAFTQSSMTSYDPKALATTFAQEFCHLLLQDHLLKQQCLKALEADIVDRDRLHRNLRRCLKHYAVNLKDEADGIAQRAASGFVLRYSDRIASDFISLLLPVDKRRTFNVTSQREDKRRLMEEYLTNLPTTPILNPDKPEQADGHVTEDDSEPAYDIEYEPALIEEEPCLNTLEGFLTRSLSFEVFRSSIQEFLNPTFESKLRLLIQPFAEFYSPYNISHLLAELRDVDLRRVKITKPTRSDFKRTWLDTFKKRVEHWSGVSWDWWPLSPPRQRYRQGERRLTWKCTCGERRKLRVPSVIASSLKDLIKEFAGKSEWNPGAALQVSSAPWSNSANSGEQSSSTAARGHSNASKNGQPALPLNPLTATPASSHAPPSSFTHTRGLHVILVVESGNRFLLSQIDVKGINCNRFFKALRMEYHQLRGFWRNWFSIWRYSHCDFYKCEKFDDQEFAPTQKDAFPPIVDRDYEYRPRPIDAMPPVSRHEFYARFYTCTDPTSLRHRLLHLLTGCKRLGLHSHERLDLFPKRLSRFEEKGNEVGVFWGIYAREKPALRYILFYNVVCLLSPFAYFFLRIFMVGTANELQDASVPIVIVAGCLSIFWSIFFGSLQDSRNAKLE